MKQSRIFNDYMFGFAGQGELQRWKFGLALFANWAGYYQLTDFRMILRFIKGPKLDAIFLIFVTNFLNIIYIEVPCLCLNCLHTTKETKAN